MKYVVLLILFILPQASQSNADACKMLVDALRFNARTSNAGIQQQTEVILAVRRTFKTLRDDPDVLSSTMAKRNIKSFVNSLGFSKSATAAVYFMLGAEHSKLIPMMAKNPVENSWGEHYWLWDAKRQILLDPTADQFTAHYDTKPPYLLSLYGRPIQRGERVEFETPDLATQKIILKATEILNSKKLKPNGQPRF